MFQDMLEFLKDKNRRMEKDFTVKELDFLFDQIILHIQHEISRDDIRGALEKAILTYDWYENEPSERTK